MGQNNQEKWELTVLSNCALVAPHFNAIAIPYWSPILILWIDGQINIEKSTSNNLEILSWTQLIRGEGCIQQDRYIIDHIIIYYNCN